MPEETEEQPQQQDERPSADVEAVETEAAEAKLPESSVTVEDAGTLKKKVTISVPRQRIDAKFEEMFGELGRTAQVPGFRIGRAPRRLIEKRFGKEVTQDVRNALVGEAMGSALEGRDFKVLSEPEIALEEIELPEEGELSFSFEVEVAPEFDLPEYKGIEINRPPAQVTDERVEEALTSYRKGYGKLKPTKRAARAGDVVVADVKIAGEQIEHAVSNVELRVAPGQIEGIPLEDLSKALEGVKAAESCRMQTEVPSGHPDENWRGKQVEITLELKEVKRLELPALDEHLAEQAGFASVDELRQVVRSNLQVRAQAEQQGAMREQVCKYLLDKTGLDVPEGVAGRYASQLLARRYVGLMLEGVPREQIDRNLERLEAAAAAQATRELRLSFILGKLADAEGIEVDEAEVNARIAQMARQYKRRPERLRQEMTNEGTLDHVSSAIREEKAIARVLESAKIVDVAPEAEKARPGGAKAKAARKSRPARKKPSEKKTEPKRRAQ